MTTKARLLAVVSLAALTIVLVSCKPVAYYLERVFKAAGTVTEAGSNVPLESVEVFLSPYQYSVLTNGLGDYGLELAEGTWALDFVKEGFTTVRRQVTVNAANPRVKVDVALTRVAGPEESWTYVGTWVCPANNGNTNAGPPAKAVFTPGTVAFYVNDYDTSPSVEASFDLKGDWTSGGAHYFKGIIMVGQSTGYILMRMTSNNALEAQVAPTDYPPNLSGAPDTVVFTRQ